MGGGSWKLAFCQLLEQLPMIAFTCIAQESAQKQGQLRVSHLVCTNTHSILQASTYIIAAALKTESSRKSSGCKIS